MKSEETELEIDKNETEMIKEIKVSVWNRRMKFQSSRKKSCMLPLTASQKGKQETASESASKTQKNMRRREKINGEADLQAWRRMTMKEIYQKGDVEEAGNYRPISTPPALYKLFSTHLYRL